MSYNYCTIQQNSVALSSPCNSLNDCKRSVICPKPYRPLHWHLGHQTEVCDTRVGSELLDIILRKGGQGVERSSTLVPSSPPFFCGSPPSRVSNPLIQDNRFKEEKQLIFPFSPLSSSPVPCTPQSSSSPNSSVRKGGCVRANFGNYPAVRVEGFDCLDRDRRNCSISALA